MCGIYGYIGKNKKFFSLVLKSLKILRSRGYDSYGLSYFDNNKLKVEKTIDKDLNKIFTEEKLNIEGNSIISHTRWATNGKVSKENTHPFMSENGKFVLVHNGIIENANILKKQLFHKKFKSDTDSEVIVNLLEEIYENNKDDDFITVLNKTFKKLKGYWSVLIYKWDEVDSIYISRNETPLVIGFNKDEIHISSDSDTFAEYVDKYFEIENYDILKLTTNMDTSVFNKYKFSNVEKTKIISETPYPYKYWLEKEINEQPEEINFFLKRNNIYTYNNVLYFPDFDENYKNLNIQFSNIILFGSGTSYHSCLLGEYFLKKKSEYNVRAYNVSDFETSDIPIQNTLFIVVSQSGETKDIYDMIVKIKNIEHSSMKYRFLSITNSKNSLISRNCDLNLFLNLSKEISVASTKTYMCSSLMLYIISMKITNSIDDDDLFIFSNIIKKQLGKMIEKIKKIVDVVHDKKIIFLASTFKNLSIANESSLKIREICYKWCISSSAKNLKHGPLALIDEDVYVFHFITDKNDYNNSFHVANEIKSRGGKNIAFTTYDNLDEKIYTDILKLEINSTVLNTLLLILPSQLLTLYLGKKIGNNLDMPRNLAKTVTV